MLRCLAIGFNLFFIPLIWLAKQGMRMTQFYNSGRCCSTRASLLTELCHHPAGIAEMSNKIMKC